MDRFDLLGPLPQPCSTTVLEASAGTGKTFTLAGLVTRYIAEGHVTLDRMLLMTFTRAATQELRQRVRSLLHDAVNAFDDPATADDNPLLNYIISGDNKEKTLRRQRIRDALANFDGATIATIHQFCHLVLKSLGTAGDTDESIQLVDNLDPLIVEVVDDLYLAYFAQLQHDPVLSREAALTLAREVVAHPGTRLAPVNACSGTEPAIRVDFAQAVLHELQRRKRQRGILGYADVLSRLATALQQPDSAAAERMRQRWSVVMVDEFQDTDPVQWQVLDRAFRGNSTLILIGDPKQAIYAFRGGDVFAYLHAAHAAGQRATLLDNWRSDSALLDRLQVVLGGAELGDPDIVVRDVAARYRGHRLVDAPHNEPFRLRVVSREPFGVAHTQTVKIDALRSHISRDMAADIGKLLNSSATFDAKPLQARDIAIITDNHTDARICFAALTDAGIPAVYTGDTDVLTSAAADDWMTLLDACDQLHRPSMVRAAALTMFFGETMESLACEGDAVTDRVSQTLRQWVDHAQEAGVPAILEAAQLNGMGQRVLSWAGGERNMTDCAHVCELLHSITQQQRYSLTALRDWLRCQRSEIGHTAERNRRLDSDEAAVQIMTVWVSKGLQFPIVYLPFMFTRYVRHNEMVRYHEDGVRWLHVGGPLSPDLAVAQEASRCEDAGEETRLAYVAMTRAQSQLVCWWAPSWDEPNGGLSRLLRGRRPGQSTVPVRCRDPERIDDAQVMTLLREWETLGGPVIEESVIAEPVHIPVRPPPKNLSIRHFRRSIDTGWRRTSYSGLIRAAQSRSVSSEPEFITVDDEVADIALGAPASASEWISPMAQLPTGATFGSLVHAVLEAADPYAADLEAELYTQLDRHSMWWPVDSALADIAAAMLPMYDTPLGPLAKGQTLRQIGVSDRLTELDFEFPLAGGDLSIDMPDICLADVGRILGRYLPENDPLFRYTSRLTDDILGPQPLRGYLSGSIDAVLRIPDNHGHRYIIVDYKTNWLGEQGRSLTAADYAYPRLVEAMLHSDYPLQALLYNVVLHRFLRWRQPDYCPEKHLGGVLYLFVRGMCGPDTPSIGDHPAGVFSWLPPARMVVQLSNVLAGQVVGQ